MFRQSAITRLHGIARYGIALQLFYIVFVFVFVEVIVFDIYSHGLHVVLPNGAKRASGGLIS